MAGIALWAVVIVGCSGTSAQRAGTASKRPAKGKAEVPSAKDAIRLLINNHDISLSVDASCKGVGTQPADQTIGDYISGFLAAQNTGKNGITAGCKPAPDSTDRWQCSVELHHSEGEDVWTWGVDFGVRKADRTVIRESVRCTGAG